MEFVYVVPRPRLFPDCYPQGFVPFGDALDREAFLGRIHEHGFFVERDHAEREPSLKQIIPYTVVESGGLVLRTRRLPKGGEARLHGKLSIGIGGHVNPVDRGPTAKSDFLEDATLRELTEELHLEGAGQPRHLGVLNDDSNPVGAVHLGLVQLLSVGGSVRIREEDVLEGRLVTREALAADLAAGANFETWSAVLVERLDEVLPSTPVLSS